MKRSHFITLVLGTIGGLVFSIGMCMCLLPEWDAFQAGMVVTAAGTGLLLAIGIAAWVRSGKKPSFNWKLIGKVAYGVLSVLVLGLGMCLVLVWQQLFYGIGMGIAGIVMLLCLIPMCKGLKKETL